jgi:hypothetical protein
LRYRADDSNPAHDVVELLSELGSQLVLIDADRLGKSTRIAKIHKFSFPRGMPQ